ncbi:MAG: hypothetical protein WBF71_13215 [Microthrixaceae bacterium]
MTSSAPQPDAAEPQPADAERTEPRQLEDLSRSELAVLGREFLLAGQLMDRAGMPHIISRFGRDVMGEVAIDEWMGASPVYTPRIQELLDFANGDVETIFKGMQFDIGAPPEFMDFRYKVIDSHHGEFWLDHCGALMDVEPLGDDYVTTMCHTIEDPTFDATAIATNRRARMEALHRPPRVPVDRAPHCHWTVTIDDDVDPLPDPEPMKAITRTLLAQMPVAVPLLAGSSPSPTGPFDALTTGEPGNGNKSRNGDESGNADEAGDEGRSDYSWPLDPDLRLEVFSQPVLVAVLEEICVQSHLLVMAMVAAVERRSSTETAVDIALKQFIGSAGLTAERIAVALGLGDGVGDLAQVLALHPAFLPRSYVDVRLDPHEGPPDTLTVSLYPCAALDEVGRDNWISILADGHDGALQSIAFAINPRFEFVAVEPVDGAVASWALVRSGSTDGRSEANEVTLTRFSTGATFEFSGPTPTPVSLSPRPT